MAELKGPLAARRLVGGDTQQVHGLGELWGERPRRGWKWLHSSSKGWGFAGSGSQGGLGPTARFELESPTGVMGS